MYPYLGPELSVCSKISSLKFSTSNSNRANESPAIKLRNDSISGSAYRDDLTVWMSGGQQSGSIESTATLQVTKLGSDGDTSGAPISTANSSLLVPVSRAVNSFQTCLGG